MSRGLRMQIRKIGRLTRLVHALVGASTPLAMLAWSQDAAAQAAKPATPLPPPVGERVARGPAWQWGDQDGNGLGTVVVARDAAGWIRVAWDNGEQNAYRWGIGGAYDLVWLPSPKPVPVVGDRVQRGKDWAWGTQGAGGLGTVVSPRTTAGWINVRWDNGESNDYRWGVEGEFDLALVHGATAATSAAPTPPFPPSEPKASSPPSAVPRPPAAPPEPPAGRDRPAPPPIGTIVARGQDWQWGDQGDGSLGKVTTPIDEEGWIGVRWENGDENNYRWGAEDAYDLMVVEAARSKRASAASTWRNPAVDDATRASIAAVRSRGGESTWNAAVRDLLLASYDGNRSGALDLYEARNIGCPVWEELDRRVRESGTTGFVQAYGVHPDQFWVGSQLGFDEGALAAVRAQLDACGLE